MKKILALLTTGAILLGGTAPIIPVGNGVISFAVFEKQDTGEVLAVQHSDVLYEDMGKEGGISKNPTIGGYIWKSSFQYETSYIQPDPDELLKTSSSSSLKISEKDAYILRRIKTFTDEDNISVFDLAIKSLEPTRAHAAIGFNATSGVAISAGVSSQTYAHTIAGANTLLVVSAWVRTSEHTLTDIKYNGVALTAIDQIQGYLNTDTQYLQYLVAPTDGTNNIVQTYSASGYAGGEAISYTGAKQTNQPDASLTDAGDGASNNFTLTLTTIADNTWMVASWQPADGTCTAGTNTVIRSTGGVVQTADNGTAQTPAGSHSLNMTGCGNRVNGKIVASFAPAADVVASSPTQDLIIINDE